MSLKCEQKWFGRQRFQRCFSHYQGLLIRQSLKISLRWILFVMTWQNFYSKNLLLAILENVNFINIRHKCSSTWYQMRAISEKNYGKAVNYCRKKCYGIWQGPTCTFVFISCDHKSQRLYLKPVELGVSRHQVIPIWVGFLRVRFEMGDVPLSNTR